MCGQESVLLGQWLADAAQRSGLSQKAFALSAGIDEADVSRVLRGLAEIKASRILKLPPETIDALIETAAEARGIPVASRQTRHFLRALLIDPDKVA